MFVRQHCSPTVQRNDLRFGESGRETIPPQAPSHPVSLRRQTQIPAFKYVPRSCPSSLNAFPEARSRAYESIIHSSKHVENSVWGSVSQQPAASAASPVHALHHTKETPGRSTRQVSGIKGEGLETRHPHLPDVLIAGLLPAVCEPGLPPSVCHK